MLRRTLTTLCIACGLTGGAWADEPERDIYGGRLEERVNSLASIQPGLGVVMHEIGYRFSSLFLAARGGNWGLAQYELKELLEAQEVAEVTRPKRAGMLKAFERNYLAPLVVTIEKKDTRQFNKRYSAAVNGCNACHTALGYGFIRFQAPLKGKAVGLDYSLKTEPKYNEAGEKK
jgi:hypothetical protein